MFLGSRVRVRDVFAGLRYVIIDEVHAFAGDDRGAHLSAILERLVEIAGRDVQRLGLSATVGNPDEILRWLQGSSKREGRLVNPGGARVAPKIEADFVGSVANAAMVVALTPRIT
jgi:ATP-dependent Lhr-like helicase